MSPNAVRSALYGGGVSLLLMLATQAQAQLAQNIFIGNPKALALGNAVTADPPGIDAIHFNPAGLARLSGRQFEIKGIAGDMSLEAEFQAGPELQYAFDQFPDSLSDPLVNGQKSELSGTSVMLPFFGLTEIPVLAAATGGVSYEVEDRNMVLATGVFVPMLLGLKREPDDPGVFSGEEVGITRLTYFSPSVGYRVSDTFYVGAALNFSYVGVGLNFDLRLPNFTIGAFDTLQQGGCFDGSGNVNSNPLNDIICTGSLSPFQTMAFIESEFERGLSTTFNVGVLWEMEPWLTLGMTYMSGARDKINGDVRIEYSQGVQGFVNNLAQDPTLIGLIARGVGLDQISVDETAASMVLEYPQHFSMGASIKVTPRFKTNIDVKWTDTAVWNEWDIQFESPVPFLGVVGSIVESLDQGTTGGAIGADGLLLPRGYESVWTWAIGLEYQYTDRLAFRLGYEPRGSSIPENKRDLFVPIGETQLYSTGFSFHWSKDTFIDGALGYVHSEQNIASNGSTNATSTAIDNFIYNPYAGYNMKTELSVIVGEISIRSTF
ncbi:MAG: outer membrane protein transport protein [Ketobacter sp.]